MATPELGSSDVRDAEIRVSGAAPPPSRGPVWIIGMMGTGKSRVGRMLAERLGWGFIDTDEVIEAQTGHTIAEIFAEEGEAAFRQLERKLATRLAGDAAQGVIATGGGMPCIDGVLDEMKRAGLVVWLRAEADEVMGRIDLSKRPLLHDAQGAKSREHESATAPATERSADAKTRPAAKATPSSKIADRAALDRWGAIAAERINVYARADVRIDRDHREADAIVDELLRWLADYGDQPTGAPCREAVVVPLGDRSYPIVLDGKPGAEVRFAATLARRAPPGRTRIGLVTDETVARLHLPRYRAALQQRGYELVEIVVPDGEESKSLAQVERVAAAFAAGRLDRRSTLVALGGGVVGDLGGFIASALYRGIPFAQLPTTLLAMVDSSVGGKTGVNLELPNGQLAKNLIGAFHQPILVFADLTTLQTLPARDLSAGLAEVAKHALLDGEAELARLESVADAARRGDPTVLEALVVASCTLKAGVVSHDEYERTADGGRALLNLGHTVGHALESASHAPPASPLRHGEAVGLGLIAAARISRRVCEDAEPGLEARIASLLARLGLPTDLDARLTRDALPSLLSLIAADKKRLGASIRYVVLPRPGAARLVPLLVDELPALLASPAAGLTLAAGPPVPVGTNSEELR